MADRYGWVCGRSLAKDWCASSGRTASSGTIVSACSERDARRQWVVSPIGEAVNETLVNGETLTMSRPLRQGDLIAVGRRAKGIVKMPFTVRGV